MKFITNLSIDNMPETIPVNDATGNVYSNGVTGIRRFWLKMFLLMMLFMLPMMILSISTLVIVDKSEFL